MQWEKWRAKLKKPVRVGFLEISGKFPVEKPMAAAATKRVEVESLKGFN